MGAAGGGDGIGTTPSAAAMGAAGGGDGITSKPSDGGPLPPCSAREGFASYTKPPSWYLYGSGFTHE